MTYPEFESKVKKEMVFDKCWNYLLCVLMLIIGVFVARKENPSSFLFFFSGFWFMLGGWGLYKVPGRFKIIKIQSSKSIEIKKEVLEKAVSFLNVSVDFTHQYNSFTYKEWYERNLYKIHLFYDEECIGLSIQGNHFLDAGLLDFGGTKKLRNSLKDEIEMFLA